MRLVAVLLLCSAGASAKLTVGNVASITTIVVNVLEIKTTIHKARVAAGKTKRVVKKVAKKVAGK